MNIVWGVVLILFTLILCWMGQMTAALAPALATRLGLTEPEADVDPAFYADVRGEAFWDMMILWTLPVAGLLLLLNNPWWPYFGLIGGGMYLYFAGRGIAQRLAMLRRGIRIGKPSYWKPVFFILALWGLIAVITMVMAVRALQ